MKFLILFALQAFSCFCIAQDPDLSYFKIGTKWIYETFEHPLPLRYGYATYQITDTAEIAGKKVFVIENDFRGGPDFMLIEDARVYFWDDAINAFQLNFDFNSDSTYQVPWKWDCGKDSGVAEAIIDSTTTSIYGTDTFQLQHITLKESGTVTNDINLQVLQNIGLLNTGFRLPVGGCPLADFDISITHLRCFEVDSIHYNFAGIPCDSTWFTLAADDPIADRISLYPNPAHGEILIKGIDHDLPYQLYTIDGVKVKEGVTSGYGIYTELKGLVLIRVQDDHQIIWKRAIFL